MIERERERERMVGGIRDKLNRSGMTELETNFEQWERENDGSCAKSDAFNLGAISFMLSPDP